MKLMRTAVLLMGALALGACDEAGTDAILAPTPALAYTRFIHAVPDTGRTDWSFIDRIDYSPKQMGMQFRGFSPYQGTFPGSRTLRIFPSSTNIAVTSNHIIESTMTLEAGKYYTIMHVGNADASRTPADEVVVMEDSVLATVAAGSFSARLVNLSALAAMDGHLVATTGTSIAGLTPTFPAVAYKAQSTYVPTATVASRAVRAADATTTTVRASATAPAGSASDATNNLTAIAGTSTGGAFTAYFFPRSVAGTSAPQTSSFTSPAIVYLYDRHPQ